jgi:hypothetical protein
MPLEVIGAGFGRTGTLSLKFALERLGFVKCYHMMEVFQHPEHLPWWADAHRGKRVDWERLYQGYRASVDWPSCNLWEEHAALYPNAKVILSTRDPESWYQSVMATIYPSSTRMRTADDPAMKAAGEWAYEVVVERCVRRTRGRPVLRDRRLQRARRESESDVAEVAPARVRSEAGLGAAVPIPRCRRSGRTVSARQHHRRFHRAQSATEVVAP